MRLAMASERREEATARAAQAPSVEDFSSGETLHQHYSPPPDRFRLTMVILRRMKATAADAVHGCALGHVGWSATGLRGAFPWGRHDGGRDGPTAGPWRGPLEATVLVAAIDEWL